MLIRSHESTPHPLLLSTTWNSIDDRVRDIKNTDIIVTQHNLPITSNSQFDRIDKRIVIHNAQVVQIPNLCRE